MDFCHDCHSFVIAISKRLRCWPELDSFWNAARRRAGSRDCRLCEMMADYIFDNPDVVDAVVPSKVFSVKYIKADCADSESPISNIAFYGRPSEHHISILVWSDPGNDPYKCSFTNYWIEILTIRLGSPAAISGSICTTPQLPSDNGPEAFAFINSWIKTCLQEHESCKKTMSGSLINEISGPELPTRVLDVGAINCEHIVLIETNGQHGNFCALSHCWGPKDALNLITTRENIKDRFSGIHFSSLPKTFQDAVIVTREIGI